MSEEDPTPEELEAYLESVPDDIDVDDEVLEIIYGIAGVHVQYATPADSHVTGFRQPLDDSDPELVTFETDEESVAPMLYGLHQWLLEQKDTSSMLGLAWFGVGPPIDHHPEEQDERLISAVWKVGAENYNAVYSSFAYNEEGEIDLVGKPWLAQRGQPLFDDDQLYEPEDLLRAHIGDFN